MDKQIIREYIHKQKRVATEDEKRVWGLIQMWNDTRAFPQFETMVRFSLKDAEQELKKPFDPMWRAQDERDFKVFSDIVGWIDRIQETKEAYLKELRFADEKRQEALQKLKRARSSRTIEDLKTELEAIESDIQASHDLWTVMTKQPPILEQTLWTTSNE